MPPLPGFSRHEPLGAGSEQAREEARAARRERVNAMAQKSWGRVILEVALKTGLVFAVFALLFWVLSLWRGY